MKKVIILILVIGLLVVGGYVLLQQEQSKSEIEVDMRAACESALIYMTFASGAEADAFVAECIAGDYPEVIERYLAENY